MDSYISIHALREEGDLACIQIENGAYQFLSTPSARRATDVAVETYQYDQISIHALREEGDGGLAGDHHPLRNFYPRPPRGGRPKVKLQSPTMFLFLSTPSARRATYRDVPAD